MLVKRIAVIIRIWQSVFSTALKFKAKRTKSSSRKRIGSSETNTEMSRGRAGSVKRQTSQGVSLLRNRTEQATDRLTYRVVSRQRAWRRQGSTYSSWCVYFCAIRASSMHSVITRSREHATVSVGVRLNYSTENKSLCFKDANEMKYDKTIINRPKTVKQSIRFYRSRPNLHTWALARKKFSACLCRLA